MSQDHPFVQSIELMRASIDVKRKEAEMDFARTGRAHEISRTRLEGLTAEYDACSLEIDRLLELGASYG